MQQQTVTTINPRRAVREDAGIVNIGAVKGSIEELVDLFIKSHDAADDFSSMLKAVSEQSHILPAVLRKLVKARAGDKFDKAKQEVEQLSMVFEEVGPM